MSDINERIAREVMGWHIDPDEGAWLNTDGTSEMLVCDWNPGSDLNACALAEAELERRDLHNIYAECLHLEIYGDLILTAVWREVFRVATSTPAQRCSAMLKALEAE